MVYVNMRYLSYLKEIRCKNINNYEHHLLMVLAMYCNDDGVSYPKAQTIIDKMRTSRRTFYRTLKTLRDKGLVIMGKNDNGYTTYEIDLYATTY